MSTAAATPIRRNNPQDNRRPDIEAYFIRRGAKPLGSPTSTAGWSFDYLSNVSTATIDRERSLRNQARLGAPLDDGLVDQYVLALEAYEVFPPLYAWRNDAGLLELMDGNHRSEAARRLGKPVDVYECRCPADVRVLITLEANARHGKASSLEDRLHHGLYAVDNGMTLVEASKLFLVEVGHLRRANAAQVADRRADDAGVDRGQWESLKPTIRLRLNTISLDNVYKEAVTLCAATRFNQPDVNDLVNEINRLRDADQQLAVIDRWRSIHAEVIAAQQLTGNGRANMKFQGPRHRLRMALGQVRGVTNLEQLASSVPQGERPALVEDVDRTIDQLTQIREVLSS